MPSHRETHFFALSWHWRKDIKKILQSLAKSRAPYRPRPRGQALASRSHSIIRTFEHSIISLLLLLASPAFFGRELDFRGQKISVEGLNEGDWFYLKGEPNSGEEELVLVYTNANPSVIKSFTAPNAIEARVLAVGGGGAGGYGTNNSSNPGGGGGGGSVKLEFIFVLPRLRRRRRLRHRRRRRSRRRRSWGWQPIVVTLNLILRCLLVLKDYFDLTL